jgi:mRNA interferase RelE/StbE
VAKYELVFSEHADADLDKIKKFYARQIVNHIETILLHRAEDVSRSRIKKLRGFETLYRLRVGNYRIFYQVQYDEVTILRVLSKDEEAEFYEEAKHYENNSDI